MAVMRDRYLREGFIKVENVFTPAEVEELRQEIREICAGRRGNIDGVEPIGEDAPADDDVAARYLGIHFPHKISDVMARYAKHEKLAAVLVETIGPNVKLMQSMVFMKHAGKPGRAWHQDEYYIPTRDRSLCGAWIALDKATHDNGCLYVIPGSHRPGILWPTKAPDSSEFDASEACYGWPYDERADAVCCEVDVGGVVFFNGYLLHASYRNRTQAGFRRSLVCHYMSAESLLPWDWDGRLPMREDMRDIVMVAGHDPYAHKGIEQLTRPFVRREK